MLFTSYEFLAFIAIAFVTYYIVPKKYQWKVLLGFSYIFYALSGVEYIAYILATTISTYIVSRIIDAKYEEQSAYLAANKGKIDRAARKEYKASIKKVTWRWLVGCLVFNFGILAVIKYADFTIINFNSMLHTFGADTEFGLFQFALPLGISFYTFQTMGYIIDVYRGKYKAEKNFGKVALFVSFFPQLIQGPISRFDDLAQTMFKEHAYDATQVSYGLQRIMWGYFKKVVVADRLLVAVKTLYSDASVYTGAYVLVGMILYAGQIYGDFTGGIDITIGIAEVFGIKVKENFLQPYFSKNIVEYWNRWHISLGSWFKEYLFYPISVCQPMLKLSKNSRKKFGDAVGKRIPVYIATIVVWFITGFWHGAAWNFIVWGLMNCLVILISEELKPLYEKFHAKFPTVKPKWWYRFFCIMRTFLLMSCLRSFDCYRDVPLTFRMWGEMFTRFNPSIFVDGSLLQIGLTSSDYVVVAVAVLLLILVSNLQLIGKGSVRDQIATKPPVMRYMIYYGLFLAIIIFGAYGIGYDSSQFIYNQF
ncbi:MAG: MBOAT family O-acyltransferase [bacterium]|nr:MBOAT family O-acyltransferase [bacterium]